MRRGRDEPQWLDLTIKDASASKPCVLELLHRCGRACTGSEWMDPAFMEAVRTRATRISLSEGDTQMLDLKLQQPR